MKKLISISLLILLGACSSAPRHSVSYPSEKMNDAIMYAISLADTPYHYGGNSPDSGFDCSGFVGHVYRHSLGVSLPRTSRELSRVGVALKVRQLRPGDLVSSTPSATRTRMWVSMSGKGSSFTRRAPVARYAWKRWMVTTGRAAITARDASTEPWPPAPPRPTATPTSRRSYCCYTA
nr:glycoside hydrolase [uncultured bacterium]